MVHHFCFVHWEAPKRKARMIQVCCRTPARCEVLTEEREVCPKPEQKATGLKASTHTFNFHNKK